MDNLAIKALLHDKEESPIGGGGRKSLPSIRHFAELRFLI
jgi:hypothetical protein